MHRVTNDVSPSKPNSIPSGSVAPTSDFHEALTTQISELTSLVHSLRDPLHPSSTTTMASKFTQPWLIDSGASSHKSGNSSLFSTLHLVTHHVVLTDGSSRPVTAKGTLHSTTSLSYVPNFPFNLLSVNQLTKVLNCSITFSPTSCVMQDLTTKKMISSGHEKGNLYYLDPDRSPLPPSIALSTTISPLIDIFAWVIRLWLSLS